MFIHDAVRHYGSKKALAKAVGVTKAAVSYWSKNRGLIPKGRAYQIQALTDGKLQVRTELYDAE